MSKLQEAGSIGRAGLLFGVSLGAMLVATPALAQDAQEPDAPLSSDTVQNEQGENVPEGATTETDASTIVVTGTRIRGRPEFTSPDPVTLIDPEVAQREGKFDTADMLQSSPIAAGSTQITSAISSNFVTNGGPGAQTIDLRGLGPNRTLVLLNGRRAGPAGTRGGVSSFDLNVLPQSIVSRVDILKTGASSIYGSDAVAGVVNLITKTETGGLEIDANVSVPQQSGGEQYRISATYGKDFGRGHFLVAADYFRQRELARGDRDYLGCPEAYTFREDGSRADLVDPRTGDYKCEDLRWGHVWTYDLEYRYFARPSVNGQGTPFGNMYLSDGRYVGSTSGVNLLQYNYGGMFGIPSGYMPSTADFQPGAFSQFIAPSGWFPTGYDAASLAVQNSYHPYVLEQSIIPDTKRYTLYAEGAFELTDNIEAFAEFLGNRRETYQNGWRQIWSFGLTGDLFNTGDFYETGTIWADGWEGYNALSPTGITNQFDSSQKVDYYRAVGGLRGDFGNMLSGWSWDAHVQYSHSNGKYRQQHFLQDVYDVSSFQFASCEGVTMPFSGRQCQDLPWTDPLFLAGVYSPEQIDFMFDWEEGKTIYTQLGGEAVVTGTLFELPAGPLGIALGVHARRDRIEDTPGDITFSPNPYYDADLAQVLTDDDPDNDGLCEDAGSPVSFATYWTYPCEEFHSNAWGFSSAGITAGEQVTKEIFGEILVPVLADQPFFKSFDVSAAARLTNVKATRKSDGFEDEDNGNWTYKLGANWAVNNWLRFRTTYGTSFRSPALFEQFLADEGSFIAQRDVDPCVDWLGALARGEISQVTADNCQSEGIPANFPGGSITAESLSSGGIGFLEAETSKAWTASVILTPTLSFLPNTSVSFAVDYFNIKVNGEISQLGPINIVQECYRSQNFPNDPLCQLFTRNGEDDNDPFAIAEITDPFINIAEQVNTGIDFTANIRHDFGRFGRFNFLGSATRQLKDDITLLPGSPEESDNGEVGSPKWAGDANFTWTSQNRKWTVFYGIDWIGKTSNVSDFLEDNGDDPCIDSFNTIPDNPVNGEPIRGRYCPDLTTANTFYHSLSISRSLGSDDEFEFTLGVANLLNTSPPRVSVLNGGEITTLGPVAVASQYDFQGRRFFVNVSRRF